MIKTLKVLVPTLLICAGACQPGASTSSTPKASAPSAGAGSQAAVPPKKEPVMKDRVVRSDEEWKKELDDNAWAEGFTGAAETRKHLDAEYALLRTMLVDLGVVAPK